MSNIGKEYINVPTEVKININNDVIMVEGKYGKLVQNLPSNVYVIYDNHKIYFSLKESLESYDSNLMIKNKNAMWGTIRTLINNMIKGVSQGFTIRLQLVGIGYRAKVENNILTLKLGYSHIINYNIPININITTLKPTLISIFGMDLQYVTRIAANIRSFKKPEPYKGKGIKYLTEIINRKEGKKK